MTRLTKQTDMGTKEMKDQRARGSLQQVLCLKHTLFHTHFQIYLHARVNKKNGSFPPVWVLGRGTMITGLLYPPPEKTKPTIGFSKPTLSFVTWGEGTTDFKIGNIHHHSKNLQATVRNPVAGNSLSKRSCDPKCFEGHS